MTKAKFKQEITPQIVQCDKCPLDWICDVPKDFKRNLTYGNFIKTATHKPLCIMYQLHTLGVKNLGIKSFEKIFLPVPAPLSTADAGHDAISECHGLCLPIDFPGSSTA